MLVNTKSIRNLIKAVDVTVWRNKKILLESVSLEIKEKDFITIIGSNGAGKSLLMKCLIGFYSPNKGFVTRASNLKIGHVPQHFEVDITVPITVQKFLHLRKSAGSEAIKKIADETDIDSLLNTNMRFLSGGELQRTILARSLIDEPELLMLDEPTQNLDIKTRLSFYRLLEKIYKSRKISVVMISHDLQMLQNLSICSSKMICLSKQICCSGSFISVLQSPEFRDIFGEETVNLLMMQQKNQKTQFVGI